MLTIVTLQHRLTFFFFFLLGNCALMVTRWTGYHLGYKAQWSTPINMTHYYYCYFYKIRCPSLESLAVVEPHTRAGGPRLAQNLKKLFYSIYIIYILKNVACKNWSWSHPKFWVISMVLLKEREIIIKSCNLRGVTN